MVESLLRYARAQAASTGRQVKVVFDHGLTTVASPGGALPSTNTAPGVQVLWERDPLGAPGKFETLQGASMLVDQVNELVRVCEVRAPGMDAFASAANSPDSFALQFGIASTNAPTLGDASSQPVTPPITCYPDGSSDSVEIVLSPLGDDDLRRSVVTLSGVTGSMKHRMMTVTDDGTEAPDTDTAPPPVPASGAAPDR